jgi:Protein of unknown function (DUF5818)
MHLHKIEDLVEVAPFLHRVFAPLRDHHTHRGVIMKLEMSVAALALLVVLSPAGFAQQFQPNQPDSSVGAAEESPAIAWSEMQTPQPVSSERAVSTPDQLQEQQPPDNPAAAPTEASGTQAQSESAPQTFTGTIVRIGDQYVLRTTDNMTYQLDDPNKAKEYEGKQVKVTGNLGAKAKLIHIQNIEASPSDH